MLITGICRVDGDPHGTGRALRDVLLCHFCGIKTAEVVFGEFGKPMLNDPEIGFSVSHSGELAVCVLNLPETRLKIKDCSRLPEKWEVTILQGGVGGAVGVDLERIRPEMKAESMRRIAQKYFSDGEKERMERAEDPVEEFFKLWTVKESFCKWTGKGLADLSGIDSCRLPQGLEIINRVLRSGTERYALSICRER